jgi:4-diphosphocytidyl-2-C-methyl-D-erythritol kinase
MKPGALPPNPLHQSARAKVNLYLRVTGRRADGYHTLDSLAVFAGAADAITAEAADSLSLAMMGPEAGTLATEPDNLVLRAARALAAATGREAKAALTLTKNLPIASGIGGGSADAAATLRALDALWDTRLDSVALRGIAATLGADVPVCIESRAMRMQGIGEVLSEVPPLPDFGLLLVNPRIAVPTPAVFRARQGGFSAPVAMPAAFRDARDLADWLRPLGNDLEAPAVAICPAIADMLAAIAAQPGCLLARMSGSGATGFGIFATETEAAAARLPPAWWRWAGAYASAQAWRGAKKTSLPP